MQLLVDVRSPEEYAEDHIAGSQWVPLTDIQAGFGTKRVQAIAQAATKPGQPQPTIVLYCHSDPRSIRAYQALEQTNLKLAVLTGGIVAWRKRISPSQDGNILSAGSLNLAQ